MEIRQTDGALKRFRVLVVDDEALTSEQIIFLLDQVECEIVGPAYTLRTALKLAGSNAIDFALLDLSLDGESIYPVCHVLRSRHVPFAFITGSPPERIEPQFGNRPYLQKPFRDDDFNELIDRLKVR